MRLAGLTALIFLTLLLALPSNSAAAWKFNPHTKKPDYYEPSGAPGASVILDVSDDGNNESSAISEIATSADANTVFSEPSADKLLIDLSKDWPKADTADALALNPADCSASQFANAIAANGNLSCAAILDADVPDTITASNYIANTGTTNTSGDPILLSTGRLDLTISSSGEGNVYSQFNISSDEATDKQWGFEHRDDSQNFLYIAYWDGTTHYPSLKIEPATPGDTLYLDSGGNVGIGVANPTTKLQVSGNTAMTGDLTITGGDITLGTTSIFSGGDTASLNNVDAIDATTENTLEAAIDTLGNLTSATALASVGTITTGTWNATDVSLGDGGTGATLSDPNAERFFMWDDDANTTVLGQAPIILGLTGGDSTTADHYHPFLFVDPDTTETNTDQYEAPIAVCFSTLHVEVVTAPNNGAGTQSWAFTLLDDAAATGLTCTISETATSCDDDGTPVCVAADSELNWFMDGTSTPLGVSQVGISFLIEPD